MVEIEIGVLRSQCLDRRIATQQKLKSEIAVWERQRNAAKARIKWMFTTDKVRAKMMQSATSRRFDCGSTGGSPMDFLDM